MTNKDKIDGLFIVKNKKFIDRRGYFKELYRENIIQKRFPFLVMSFSKKNVVRGLHIQKNKMQGKFVTVLKGKIFDVAVDLRKKSKTFGKYFSIVLKHDDDYSLYIPKNFAHGFVCLSEKCVINYKLSNYRYKTFEKTINWNDSYLKIKWPIKDPIISIKDKYTALNFKDYFRI